MYIFVKEDWIKKNSKLINYLKVFKSASIGKIKKQCLIQMSMSETG